MGIHWGADGTYLVQCPVRCRVVPLRGSEFSLSKEGKGALVRSTTRIGEGQCGVEVLVGGVEAPRYDVKFTEDAMGGQERERLARM
jgi:hypothetical protein